MDRNSVFEILWPVIDVFVDVLGVLELEEWFVVGKGGRLLNLGIGFLLSWVGRFLGEGNASAFISLDVIPR